MKELAVDCTMTEKIIKTLQQQVNLAKDMNHRNIILSVEEAEILIEILGTSTDEEFVRCKDCRHRDPEDHKCDCGHDIQWQLPRADDWFCADGERR